MKIPVKCLEKEIDIHGRMTEGHMPGNEMCNYWMQEGHMYGKKTKGHVFF